MWLRLRQICLVARELKPVEEQLNKVLGINVCFRDPGVAFFGLENALFPIGNQLLEVVAPVEENTAGWSLFRQKRWRWRLYGYNSMRQPCPSKNTS